MLSRGEQISSKYNCKSQYVNNLQSKIADRLRELRTANGISQADLGRELKIHVNSVRNHEYKRINHTMCTILMYCKFYNISLEQFMDGIDE